MNIKEREVYNIVVNIVLLKQMMPVQILSSVPPSFLFSGYIDKSAVLVLESD